METWNRNMMIIDCLKQPMQVQKISTVERITTFKKEYFLIFNLIQSPYAIIKISSYAYPSNVR